MTPIDPKSRRRTIEALHQTAEDHDSRGAHDIAAAYRELAAFRGLADEASSACGTDVLRVFADFVETGLAKTEAL